MELPPELLKAISEAPAGRVALVIGAGCSTEPPTSLPLSRDLAFEAHRRLIADNALAPGTCADPYDLSLVADAVYARWERQRELVDRLPVNAFKQARPNEGHLIAAALLKEQAIASLVTLNFDLAMNHALSRVGGDKVEVIAGPEDHHRLSVINMIYLHRSAMADAESWMLRSVSLESDWKDRWEEVIVSRFVSSPVTVFAGLGSRAAVLAAAVDKIRVALPEGCKIYQVDMKPYAESVFATEMRIAGSDYIQSGWSDFMRALGARLASEQGEKLHEQSTTMIKELDLSTEPIIARELASAGLLELGRVRAQWLLANSSYEVESMADMPFLGELVTALEYIRVTRDVTVTITEQGLVRLWRGEDVIAALGIVSGRGGRPWAALEAEVRLRINQWRNEYPTVRAVLVGSARGPGLEALTPPPDIVQGQVGSTIASARYPRLIPLADLAKEIDELLDV